MTTHEGMGRRIMKDWSEQDVHTGWRALYCYTQRAGVTAKIKRITCKRERREARDSIKRGEW